MQGWLGMRCASWQTTDYCQDNIPWRKRTGLATWCFPELARACTHCVGKHGICSRSSRPHIQLSGVGKQGMFMALRAQPYPRPLCNRIAKAIVAKIGQNTSGRGLGSFFCGIDRVLQIVPALMPTREPSRCFGVRHWHVAQTELVWPAKMA